MTPGSFISDLINQHTQNDIVNLNDLVDKLGIEQVEIPNGALKTFDKGRMVFSKWRPVMAFNASCTNSEKNTLRAVMVAHGLLNPDRLHKQGFLVDEFYFRELRRMRTSKEIMLATNIAIPQSIRTEINSMRFDLGKYASMSELLPMFVSCSVSDSSVNFILENCMGMLNIKNPKDMPLLSNILN